MTLNSDAKFEEKLTYGSKNNLRNLMNFNSSLKIWTLMCYFSWKFIMYEPKKYRGIMCHNTEEWCKSWGGTDLSFEKWHEEFSGFWPNTRKSQNLHFDVLVLSKAYKVLDEKVQKSYVSWH